MQETREEKIVKHQYGAYTLLFLALAAGFEKLKEVIGTDSLIFPIVSTLLAGAGIYFFVKWIYDLKNRQGRIQIPVEKLSRKKDLKILGIIFGIIVLIIIIAVIIAVS